MGWPNPSVLSNHSPRVNPCGCIQDGQSVGDTPGPMETHWRDVSAWFSFMAKAMALPPSSCSRLAAKLEAQNRGHHHTEVGMALPSRLGDPRAHGTYSSFLRVQLVRRAWAMAGPPSLLMEFSRKLRKHRGWGGAWGDRLLPTTPWPQSRAAAMHCNSISSTICVSVPCTAARSETETTAFLNPS